MAWQARLAWYTFGWEGRWTHPAQLLLIFAGVVVWLFVSLFMARLAQKNRSPLRTMLLVAATLVAVVLGVGFVVVIVGYTVR